MTPPNATHVTYASQCGQLVWLIIQYAIRAPAAPTAPNARFSTPVALYSTTMPTPESAYTPPSARPSTMYGFRNSQSTPNTEKATTLDIGNRGHPDQCRCCLVLVVSPISCSGGTSSPTCASAQASCRPAQSRSTCPSGRPCRCCR